MNPFEKQVALVTGAGSGLGRQLALDLARAGAAIAAVDLQPGPLETLAAELAGKPFAWAVADVTDYKALQKAATDLQQRLGPIDLLIASAGIGRPTPALDFSAADFERIVRVNLIGVANSIAAVLPGMIQRQRGQLVALSSIASLRGLPHMAGYCASKAGVNALCDALRVELQPLGIAVTAICPSWVRTPMTANLDVELPFLLEVADASRRILNAIRRRQAYYVFPPAAARRMRFVRWLPLPIADWLVRRMLAARTKKV